MKVNNPGGGGFQILYTREVDIYRELSTEELSDFLLFFSPRTVEEHSVQTKITPEIIKEVREFASYFTRTDVADILTSKDSKQCLYAIAAIIWRIRSEQSIFRINGINTFSAQVTEAIRGSFQSIILKENVE